MDRRPKILIVDDNPANLFSLKQILKATDADIIQAQNGNEALAASLNHDFALVLLDVEMPVMDGYEVAKWLRGEDQTKQVPIIFISAVHSSDYSVFLGYEAGAVDFMTKPFNPDILLSKVKVFLEMNRQKAQLIESENMLALANETLEMRIKQRTAELEQFAYVVSHDLQEPLRMVASFIQLLAKRYQGKLDEDADKYIHFAVDGANRMREMITSILRYSRINTTEKDFDWVDCNKVVDTVLSDLSLMISETNATVTSDALPKVWGVETKLHQVFQNLVANAIKFRSDDPPRIHITNPRQESLSHLDEAPVLAGNPGCVVFSVKDNGIGLDLNFATRIFEVFQRLHGQEQYPGIGIGLSICKRIIDQHGGSIWVDSEIGKGSTFFFTLWQYQSTQKPEFGKGMEAET